MYDAEKYVETKIIIPATRPEKKNLCFSCHCNLSYDDIIKSSQNELKNEK